MQFFIEIEQGVFCKLDYLIKLSWRIPNPFAHYIQRLIVAGNIISLHILQKSLYIYI